MKHAHTKTETGIAEATLQYESKDQTQKQKLSIGIKQTALSASKTMVFLIYIQSSYSMQILQ